MSSNETVWILDLARFGDIKHDPYGTVTELRFCIAEYTYALHGETLPEFRPSPFLTAGEGWAQLTGRIEENILDELIRNDIIFGIESLRKSYTILSRFASILDANGRSY